MPALISVLIIAVYLVIWYFAAKVFAEIAVMKGHNGKRYFWWSFLVGPIGMMMVIALPDRRSSSGERNAAIADELPDL